MNVLNYCIRDTELSEFEKALIITKELSSQKKRIRE